MKLRVGSKDIEFELRNNCELKEGYVIVICRNCNDVSIYDEKDITDVRKKWQTCSMCGNRTHDYEYHRRWANTMIKKYNHQEVADLLKQDKYNTIIFGKDKGFDYIKYKDSMKLEV